MTIRFRRFVIENYRAIRGPLEVDLSKMTLMPIIGVNECGKTTILQAIFAFDHYNDNLNDGRHLRDVENLYATTSPHARVSADFELELQDVVDTLDQVAGAHSEELEQIAAEAKAAANDPKKMPQLAKRQQASRHVIEVAKKYYRKRRQFPLNLRITRNIQDGDYSFEARYFTDRLFNNLFAKDLFRLSPFILYFDDFRDSIEDRIEITAKGSESGWLEIIEQLFQRTDEAYSVFDLPAMEERKRKTVLARVTKRLNDSLTREWQNFQLNDDRDALRVSLEFVQEEVGASARNFIKLDVIETAGLGEDFYFAIRDRSKGFFWFFNFVMKLEFNPKVIDENSGAIYLLDEPGSYLHASAQSKLCSKLRRLSNESAVIFCTHSHYLLDPEIIPLSSIRIAEKASDGSVSIQPIYQYEGGIVERRSAFQPIIDALQVKPFAFDLNCRLIVLVEGIIDYYIFQMFSRDPDVRFLPSMNADSIRYFVSLLIAIGVPFRALWDNDAEGELARTKTAEYFGEEVAARSFFLLSRSGHSKRIVQDLVDGRDVVHVKEALRLPRNSSFDKTITTLFYSPRRPEILATLPGRTADYVESEIRRVVDTP